MHPHAQSSGPADAFTAPSPRAFHTRVLQCANLRHLVTTESDAEMRDLAADELQQLSKQVCAAAATSCSAQRMPVARVLGPTAWRQSLARPCRAWQLPDRRRV
jgi:hypothetical protein